MPSLDLSLRMGMIRRASNVAHGFVFDVFEELTGDVAGAII